MWNHKVNEDIFNTEINWGKIIEIADSQTVSVVIADAINTMPDAVRPSVKCNKYFLVKTVQTLCANEKLNGEIAFLVKQFTANAVNPILLKGQGVAKNYNIPEHRICGDIDFYAGINSYDKACNVLSLIDNAR